MEAHTNDAPTDNLPLTRRELAIIVAFWMMYAILVFANRLFDAMARSASAFQSGWLVVPLLDSVCWAVLTVPLFWLAARYGTESVSRGRKLLVFGTVGIVVVVVVGLFGTAIRAQFGAPPPNVGNRPHRSFGPPPFWFGMLNALVIYLGVIAAGIARAYSLRYRARREQTNLLERQLAEARLDALRRQLDPHFLFNTLNVISSLVERDPRGVRRMISRLGGLLRFSLEGADAPEITLRQELVLLEQYLDIMQVRFQGRLETVIEADPRTLDALVPTLILQPLVENAIKHGIERQRDGGRIFVETLLDGDMLVLRVSDNGAGLDASERSRDNGGATNTGVGLRNTRARLAQLYGSRHRFTLSPAPERGAVAEVRLPLNSVERSETANG
jgi:two-component system, LytTR family, sensor kinase